MLNAYDLGMITSTYAYFTFEMLVSSCKGTDGRDGDACRAFEGLFDIGQYIPSTSQYRLFKKRVRERMPEFSGMGYHMQKNEEVECQFYSSTLINYSCF